MLSPKTKKRKEKKERKLSAGQRLGIKGIKNLDGWTDKNREERAEYKKAGNARLKRHR